MDLRRTGRSATLEPTDVFDITGTAGSGHGVGFGHIGTVVGDQFVPSDRVRRQVIADYLAAQAAK
ncbi:MAG: hypothetical protein H0W63_03970 [Gemmatimonadaceae bacterium]|nr:hypothetical protein [Gemmatimonadaceae bacterium]